MARSFSNAKLLSEVVAKAINRRGFSVSASQAAAETRTTRTGPAIVKKTGEEVVGSTEKVSWIPDPRTGFYRPENRPAELDAAELRAALLKKH